MAQTVQIVPRYLHSHVETVINDYTTFDDTPPVEVDDSVKFLAVFMGPQGIDNTLVKVKNTKDFETIFGRSNYALYGQPMMMAEAELRSGEASVWCMRIMPDDAKFANSVLSVYYKPDVAKKKFRIKFKAKALVNASAVTSKTDLLAKGQTLDGTPGGDGLYKDADGYIQLPLITFRAMGRGAYANNYRWRMARNKDCENDYNIKMYSFEALSATNGISTIATYRGTVVDSEKFNRSTLINDIVDDSETGIAPIDIQAYENNYQLLYEAYVKFLKDVETATPATVKHVPTIDEFDPFFAYGMANNIRDEFIQFTKVKTAGVESQAGYVAEDYTETNDIIQVDNVEGTLLAGGSDGAFANADANARDQAIAATYIKAFNGSLDPIILANKRVPVDAIFDANYPYEVKKELAALALARNDCMCFIDCGLVESFSSGNQMKLIENYGVFNTRGISKNPQWYTIKDPITRKRVPVTITYFFAENYAAHVRDNGFHIPFTNVYAQLSGHIKNSLQPAVNEHESSLKEWLYTNRFNYFEAVGENIFRRASQNTSQIVNSDLLEENNMTTLFRIKHILETDAKERLYNFAEADDRNLFTAYETAKFSSWIGRMLQSFTIDFQMNEFEAERSILHCYVTVQFKTLNKRTIIEIDVNKRDFGA